MAVQLSTRRERGFGGPRMTTLLEVSDLRVDHDGQPIVDGVDFSLQRGEALGLAGGAGGGENSTALALMKLPPPTMTPTRTATLRPPGGEEPGNNRQRP